MQLALDIEDEIIEANGEVSVARPSAPLPVGGIKGNGLTGGFGVGRHKVEFRSGNTHFPPGLKQAQNVVPARGGSTGGTQGSSRQLSSNHLPGYCFI